MQLTDFSRLDLSRIPSPCFVVDTVALERNLAILKAVSGRSGATVLQALKAFSMHSVAATTMQYLKGTCCSGLHEALLAKEFYPGEIHVFAPAYREPDLRELLGFADHIVFNNLTQLARFEDLCREALSRRPDLRFGLRINPMHSEAEVPLYDPCAPRSRLGVTREELDRELGNSAIARAFDLVSGLHFHTLCEQMFPPLERTLEAMAEQFSDLFSRMEWINFGGGHHITREGYDIDALIVCIQEFNKRHGLKVFLEPGEASAIGTGVLVTEVLDIGFNEIPQAILDTSATCHMPDTLEMPYRADILNAGLPGEKPYTYRLGGLSCLAGDVMGDYSFDHELEIGERLVVEDMAHYTMVKTNTFNGIPLPAIALWDSETDDLSVVRAFGYGDFRSRLS